MGIFRNFFYGAAMLAGVWSGDAIAQEQVADRQPDYGVQGDFLGSFDGSDRMRSRFFFYDFDQSGDRTFYGLGRFVHEEDRHGFREDQMGVNVPFADKESGVSGFSHLFGMESEKKSGYGVNSHWKINNFRLGLDAEALDTDGDGEMNIGPSLGYDFESPAGKTSVIVGYNRIRGGDILTFYGLHELPAGLVFGAVVKHEDGPGGGKNRFTAAIGEQTRESYKGVSWRVDGTTDTERYHNVSGIVVFGPNIAWQPKVFGKLNRVDGAANVKLLDDVMDFPKGLLQTERGNTATLEAESTTGFQRGFRVAGTFYPAKMAGVEFSGRVNPFVSAEFADGAAFNDGYWKAGGGVSLSLDGRDMYRRTDATDSLDVGVYAIEKNGSGRGLGAQCFVGFRKVF